MKTLSFFDENIEIVKVFKENIKIFKIFLQNIEFGLFSNEICS